MSFKENLLKKIKINQLSREVRASIGTAESGLKVDKDAMRSLLAMSPYEYQKERDLDLFILKRETGLNHILVLDNELPIYETTVEDVLIRKSPYTKEMLSIKNIVKILKDSDVKLSRKEASLDRVQKQCIDALDLTYDAADIEAIAREGSDAFENNDSDGVVESLSLFAELLDYRRAPKALRIPHHEIFGALTEKQGGEFLYGPAVIFSRIVNLLVMFEDTFSSADRGKMALFHKVARGEAKAAIEGVDVFRYLKDAVLKQPQS